MQASPNEGLETGSLPAKRYARRSVLRGAFWIGLGGTAAAFAAAVAAFIAPHEAASRVILGNPANFPPGSKTYSKEGRCWLVSLTAEQGGPGFFALFQRCTHGDGAAVTRLEDFTSFTVNGDKKGVFWCPSCHSTFDEIGMRLYGPAPRTLDRVDLRFDGPDGLYLYPHRIAQGSRENASWAVKV